MWGITARPIGEMSEAEWDNIMDVNAKGTFLVNKAAVIQMRAQGGGGRIINISSVAGKFGTRLSRTTGPPSSRSWDSPMRLPKRSRARASR